MSDCRGATHCCAHWRHWCLARCEAGCCHGSQRTAHTDELLAAIMCDCVTLCGVQLPDRALETATRQDCEAVFSVERVSPPALAEALSVCLSFMCVCHPLVCPFPQGNLEAIVRSLQQQLQHSSEEAARARIASQEQLSTMAGQLDDARTAFDELKKKSLISEAEKVRACVPTSAPCPNPNRAFSPSHLLRGFHQEEVTSQFRVLKQSFAATTQNLNSALEQLAVAQESHNRAQADLQRLQHAAVCSRRLLFSVCALAHSGMPTGGDCWRAGVASAGERQSGYGERQPKQSTAARAGAGCCFPKAVGGRPCRH